MSEPRKGNTWPQIPRPPLKPSPTECTDSHPLETRKRATRSTYVVARLLLHRSLQSQFWPEEEKGAECGEGGLRWGGRSSMGSFTARGRFSRRRSSFPRRETLEERRSVLKKRNNTSVAYFTVARRVTGTRCTCWMVGQAGESREISWEADRRAESFPKLRAFRNFREPEEGRRKERVGFVKQVRFSQAKNLVREKPNCAFYHL